MFDHKTNSIKKLWKNLYTVCSLNKSKMNSNAINKLVINNHTLNDQQDICN